MRHQQQETPREWYKDSITDITSITNDSKELPTAPPFPVGAMPEGCRRLIEEAAAAIGCPPEFVALPMLAVLSSAIGNSRVLRLKRGWEEGASIFAAVIADPGEKKTPALKVALEPAKKAQAALKEKYQRAEDEYKREAREYEVDKKGAAKAGEPAPPPPQEPTMERTLVEDTTVERLAGIQGENPRGVVVVRDELSGWARAMDQYKQGGRGADRQFWLSAWSNSYVSVDRKSQPHPLIVSRPFAALFGAIQPGVLPELGDGREDGLLDRFLFAYPEAELSGWTDDEISEKAESSYASLHAKLRVLYMPTDEYDDPDPVRIHLSPDAKVVMVEAINELRREMYAPGFPARLRGPWSKLEAYFARLILILATARAADTEAAERVETTDVLAAVVLLDYFKGHARRVYVGLHEQDPDERLAADIAEFLKERGGVWDGQPAELLAQLESDHKPPRANELTKRLKAVAAKTPGLDFEAGERWDKELQNKRRFVRVSLRNVGNAGNVGNGGAS
jgi:putative DNA primase/helicase